MRTLLKVTIPVEAGNKAIKDGTLPKTIQSTTDAIKPEASYFFTENGKRTAFFFFDLKDPSSIPQISEPLFINLNAEVQYYPVMNANELKAGLEKTWKSKERVPAGV